MSSTIAGTDTNAGETWTCTVTPNDGDDDGVDANASIVISVGYIEETVVFDATGDHQYWWVPAGVTEIIADAWGAGGGTNNHNEAHTAVGGGGGYANATLPVEPCTSLLVAVGEGGNNLPASASYGGGGLGEGTHGNGGGLSGLFAGDFVQEDAVIIAGGGGGGGDDTDGGAGGGELGQDAEDGAGGEGGSQFAGGNAGMAYGGSALLGGNTDEASGGGGGGGYFGGGGGTSTDPRGEGGGGSGFILGGSGTLETGSYQTPANSGSADRGVAGEGGTQDNGTGTDGRLIIRYVNEDPTAECDPMLYTNSVGGTMIAISAGTFDMGCTPGQSDCESHESPVHTVTLTRNFWIGETEVTREQWESVKGAGIFSNPTGGVASGYGDYPANKIYWEEIIEYANALSDAEGLTRVYDNSSGDYIQDLYADGYRLPTEAEWEYAARCGEDTLYAGSDNMTDVGWYDDNSGYSTHRVATMAPNACGLYDMSGNVWEWTWDWYDSGYYGGGDMTDPTGPSSGTDRVRRGGSWVHYAGDARVSFRWWNSPGEGKGTVGFRLVRTIP
jgi:formylglycine-generating enzyme required for sulfatase activity